MVVEYKRNPVHQDSGTYAQCIVAFLDILGFKSKVLESLENLKTLVDIVTSLRFINRIPSGGKKVSSHRGLTRKIIIRSRFFSDSLSFYLKENPEDIAHLFFLIRFLQDRLWEKHICLRGAITLGKMYWPKVDDNITVGPGHNEAYEIESKIAKNPRIVIAKSIQEYISSNQVSSAPFGFAEEHLLADFLVPDGEVFFLDLLNPRINRREGEELHREGRSKQFTVKFNPNARSRHQKVLQEVDQLIEKHITCKDERVRAKYEWLRAYRNQINAHS